MVRKDPAVVLKNNAVQLDAQESREGNGSMVLAVWAPVGHDCVYVWLVHAEDCKFAHKPSRKMLLGMVDAFVIGTLLVHGTVSDAPPPPTFTVGTSRRGRGGGGGWANGRVLLKPSDQLANLHVSKPTTTETARHGVRLQLG